MCNTEKADIPGKIVIPPSRCDRDTLVPTTTTNFSEVTLKYRETRSGDSTHESFSLWLVGTELRSCCPDDASLRLLFNVRGVRTTGAPTTSPTPSPTPTPTPTRIGGGGATTCTSASGDGGWGRWQRGRRGQRGAWVGCMAGEGNPQEQQENGGTSKQPLSHPQCTPRAPHEQNAAAIP